MSEFSTYEHVVAQKIEGIWRLRRVGLILLYVVFILAWFAFGFFTHLFPLMALMPVTAWILVFFTWRYVKVEYEYSATSGIVTFSSIYGNRSRRKTAEFRLRDCALIAPLDLSEDHVRAFAPVKTVNALSSISAPDAYVALVDDGGIHTAVYFEATEKMLKICRFYNASCTVIGAVRY